jgi:hypothetical protein
MSRYAIFLLGRDPTGQDGYIAEMSNVFTQPWNEVAAGGRSADLGSPLCFDEEARLQTRGSYSSTGRGISERGGITLDLAQIRLAALKVSVLIRPVAQLVFERPFGVFYFNIIFPGSHVQSSH